LILRRIATRNFRNLRDSEIELHPGANILVGDNGQGKTNLLEAIYFLATTKSFRTTRLAHLPKLGSTTTYVEGDVEDAAGILRRISAGISLGPERKRELLVNRQRTTLHDYLGFLPVFAYSAARLAIVRGGPDERRRFLDRGIASIRGGYLKDLGRFSRALKQRNALLQQGGAAARRDLDAWDAELIDAALPVTRARAGYAADLAKETKRILKDHAYHVSGLSIEYRPSGFEEGIGTEQGFRALQALRRRELAVGFSLAGPHRDGLDIQVDGEPAAEILSSGEVKMTVLFLKLAKIELYRSQTGEEPLFLLDDVDAELDLGIIERLLRHLVGRIQLVTTSPKDAFFERFSMGPNRRFTLSGGGVEPVGEG
jgi:DNA replication and repair protein RecF